MVFFKFILIFFFISVNANTISASAVHDLLVGLIKVFGPCEPSYKLTYFNIKQVFYIYVLFK